MIVNYHVHYYHNLEVDNINMISMNLTMTICMSMNFTGWS